MIEKVQIDKLTRIAETLRALAAEAQKEERSHLSWYKKYYENQYILVKPILYYVLDYELEFQSLRKPEDLSYSEIKPALIQLSTFVDSVIKQETLGNRQQEYTFEKEYFIEDNKPFSAYQQITSLVNQAVSTLKIIDNYVDDKSLEFFLAVNTQTSIELLTMQCIPNKQSFLTSLAKFKSQWG